MATPVGTEFQNFLKEVYGDIYKTIPLRSPLYKYLQKKAKSPQVIDGRYFTWPVVTGVGGSGGFYNEAGPLYAFNAPTASNARALIVQQQETVAFTNKMIESGKRDLAGFDGNTKAIIKLAIENFTRKLNISHYMHQVRNVASGLPADASKNGVVAQVTAFAPGPPSTITITNPLGYAAADLGGVTKHTKHIIVGDVFAYGTVAGLTFTPKGIVQVTAINRDTNVLTVNVLNAAGGNPANLDRIVWCSSDSRTNNSFGLAANGLGAIFDQAADSGGQNQVFQNIAFTPNDTQAWKSTKIQSGGPFLQSDLHKVVRSVQSNGPGDPKVMVADPSIMDLYAATLSPDVRFAPQKLDGGYDAPPVFASGSKNIPWEFDNHCPYGMIFFLDTDYLFYGRLGTPNPDWDKSGGDMWKWIPNADGMTAFFKWYFNCCYEGMNPHGVLFGITTPNAPT